MTTGNSALDLELRRLASQLGTLQSQVKQLQRGGRATQLDLSSIENGALTFNDADGNPQIVLGLQDDGSFAHVAQNGTDPPQPSDPDITAGIGVLQASWDGFNADGTLPLSDFAALQVHVSTDAGYTPDATTLQGTLTVAGIFTIAGLTAGTTYYVVFEEINASGIVSAPSDAVPGVPQSVSVGISPGSISQLLLAAATGKNLLVDPQFTVNAYNSVRLADPATTGTWSIDQINGLAQVISAAGTSRLALMPSNGVPLFINPGETYFLQVTVNLLTGSGVTAGIEIAGLDGITNETISQSGLSTANTPATLAGQVTIPPGQSGAYVRVFTTGGAGAVVQFSDPVAYNTNGTNELQPNSVTAESLAADSVTAFAIAVSAVTAGTIDVGALDGMTIQAPVINGGTITGTDFIVSGVNGALFAYATGGQQTVVFGPGSPPWECPDGVLSVFAEVVGASASASGTSSSTGKTGSGGAEYAAGTVAVTPGNVYTPNAGLGPSGSGSAGTDGPNSSFAGDSTTITAHGGKANGTGGTGSTAPIHFDGGDGGQPGTPVGIGHAGVTGSGGGGGGSAGGPTGAGHDGGDGGSFSGGTGGSSVGNGRGGPGGEREGDGGAGLVPGGGAGGAGGTSSGDSGTQQGGDGADGQVKLTFTSTAPALVAAITGVPQSDPFAGVPLLAGVSLVNGMVAAALTASPGGAAIITNASGLQQYISGNQLNSVNTPTVTTTANSSLGFMTVPANDVETDCSYHIYAFGLFTTGASVPSSATFNVYWGGISGVVIGTAAIPTLTANLSNAGWFADADVTWLSLSEVAVTLRIGWHTAGGIAGSVTWFTTADTTGLDTTTDRNLSLGFKFGSAPASTQLQTTVCRIGRCG